MAKTSPAATATTQADAPVAKEPSKMELARKLFQEIYTKGFDLGGKSQRQVFIDRKSVV